MANAGVQDLLYQLENAQNQLDRLQLDNSRESQYSRDAQLRETALQEQLIQVKMIMVCTLSSASVPRPLGLTVRIGSEFLHRGSHRCRPRYVYERTPVQG